MIKTFMDELIFDIPQKESSIIKVIGVGGGGGNAVEYMHKHGIPGVDFIVCNTDAQSLEKIPIKNKILLGETLTNGVGSGGDPKVGEQAAIESLGSIRKMLKDNTKMIFITAGMGGGTGTGAVPVIAKEAKELGILTIAVLTIPFQFEGYNKYNKAISGIKKTKENVDGLVLINNEILKDLYMDIRLINMFSKANDVLLNAIKGIAEIITMHGYINLDLADIQTIMKDCGLVIIGYAKSKGEKRSLKAVEKALNSPLLNNVNISGAKNILLNITSGDNDNEITLDEVGEITSYIKEAIGTYSQIIWGIGINSLLKDDIAITLIATQFEKNTIPDIIDIPEKVELFGDRVIEFDFKFGQSQKVISPDMDEKLLQEFEKYPAYVRYNK